MDTSEQMIIYFFKGKNVQIVKKPSWLQRYSLFNLGMQFSEQRPKKSLLTCMFSLTNCNVYVYLSLTVSFKFMTHFITKPCTGIFFVGQLLAV